MRCEALEEQVVVHLGLMSLELMPEQEGLDSHLKYRLQCQRHASFMSQLDLALHVQPTDIESTALYFHFQGQQIRINVSNDATAALASGTGGHVCGCVLIAGTGACQKQGPGGMFCMLFLLAFNSCNFQQLLYVKSYGSGLVI